MIYIVIASTIVCCCLLLMFTKHRNSVVLVAIMMLTSLIGAFFSFTVYICKMSFHLSFFQRYFGLSDDLIFFLYRLPLSKSFVLCVLNFCCVVFLAANVRLITSNWGFSPSRKARRVVLLLTSLYLIAQLILYDPFIYPVLYRLVYPNLLKRDSITTLYTILRIVTSVINAALLAFSVIMELRKLFYTPPLKFLRVAQASFTLSYVLLIVTYAVLMWQFPRLLVSYASKADIVVYNLIFFGEPQLLYNLYPYILALLIVLVLMFSCRLTILKKKLENNNLKISRTIDDANIPAKTLCHYIKNEVLALSTELNEIRENRPNAMDEMQEHLEYLYKRLEVIHKSIKQNTLELKQASLNLTVNSAVEAIKPFLNGTDIRLRLPKETLVVIIDTKYFEQALICMLQNACDACRQIEHARKPRIEIILEYSVRYALIDIIDNGCGIRKSDIDRVFTPFFSSKPSAEAWGIGLSLAHKLIISMGGQIEVESVVGAGTTFHLFLPCYRQDV